MSGPSASLMTLKDWLQQRIPVVGVSDFGGTPSRRILPRPSFYLKRWVDLADSVRDYLQQCDDSTRHLEPLAPAIVRTILTLRTSSERSASHAFQNVLEFLGMALGQNFSVLDEVSVPSSLESDVGADEQAAMLASSSREIADMVLRVNDKDVLVVEMRRPAVFRRTVSSAIPSLCDIGDRVGSDPEPPADAVVILHAVQQLYDYMVGLGLAYGILSSFDLTYVAHRGGEDGETFFISDGIPRMDPNFLATLAYILQKSFNEPVSFKRAVRKVNALATAPGSLTTPGSEDGKTRKRKAEIGTGLRKGMRTRSQGFVLSETPAELLHLARHHFATGWSGKIVRGTYEGQSVVVKLAPVGSDRAKALLTEVEAYHMLKEVWGKYVPQLVSYGTTSGGSIVYIAMEEIMGHEIGMGPLSQAMVEEIFDALAVVHQCGILHGDIRPSNILVANGRQAGVRFLDFGFACFVTSDVGCKREYAQLEFLLSEFTCLDVTSQFQLKQR